MQVGGGVIEKCLEKFVLSGFYLGFFVSGGGVDPKKFLEPRSGEKKFFQAF